MVKDHQMHNQFLSADVRGQLCYCYKYAQDTIAARSNVKAAGSLYT